MWQPGSLIAALALGAACALVPAIALGQTFEPIGVNIEKAVNGVLGLMGYMLTPDVTTGSLSLSNEPTGNPDIGLTSLGGGFTMSKAFPLYLEGTVGYSRYDPTFIASNGTEERAVPVKWNAFTVTGGVGWDFPVAEELVLRPMFNFSFGHVESDTSLAGRFIESEKGVALDFLEHGQLDSYGLGGSLVLDYERYRPENEIDVELRYTDIYLQSYGSTSTAVEGSADARSVNLWTRWRAPTGMTMLERPLRYVLEYAHTAFFGDLDGALGFNHLNSVGAGFEVDSSKYDIIVTRTRLVARYKFGENVRGWSVGLAVSF
ncbi:MAG TPA: autotransporter outer membrane beta-barrel domain-containing protein [Burkholderiales bacterium]|nr:autotransporter outer membrane beta-barrel domain-containing protein [Burkholderiales bacterium]